MTDQERRVCNRRREGYTILAICGEFGLTPAVVKRILAQYQVRESSVIVPSNHRKHSAHIGYGRNEYNYDELMRD